MSYSNSISSLLSRMNSDTVDYEDSCLIVRYLASMRPFAQSFDIYLTQVRLVLFFFLIFEIGLNCQVKYNKILVL